MRGNPFGALDVFLEYTIVLMLTTRAANILCSLSTIVSGSSTDTLMTYSAGVDAYAIAIGLR